MTASRPRRDQLPLSFRYNAENVSASWRRRIGVDTHCRLDTEALVAELGVLLVPLSDFTSTAPRAVFQLWVKDQRAFSASAICREDKPLAIVFNDGHETPRQRANIAHEC